MEVSPVLKRVRTRTPLVLREPGTIQQLRSLADYLKEILDGMNEMSDIMSQHLDISFDRRSKAL